jgi:inosine-uridine nucleoside N-ribohydrolase
MTRFAVLLLVTLAGMFFGQIPNACAALRIPESAHNLLVDAKIQGNLESFDKGLRGKADHMIYDLQQRSFFQASAHHEYGVGFGRDLGVVTEDKPAWWMAEWPQDVEANLIVLSGVYGNQAQPNTGWKIELRRNGRWTTHARGVGGWYDRGQYVWGGLGTEPLTFDALRVSVFSKDKQTSIKSIHFRGEVGVSWVIANCAPIDARVVWPTQSVRMGVPASFAALPVLGDISSWQWQFGDGTTGAGSELSHIFSKPGNYEVRLAFSDGQHSGQLTETVVVDPPVGAWIQPLDSAVMVGQSVMFSGNGSVGEIKTYAWDWGDGQIGKGRQAEHRFAKAGIYRVVLTVSDGSYSDECSALMRVHTHETLGTPQVLLDTDQKNEQDDQHYLGYGLFSDLDILGVNSVHHGGGQEPVNYAEILKVIDLALQSGLDRQRKPLIFRGANARLSVPTSGIWSDTTAIRTAASEAILAVARAATPENPVWVVPVGPGTNVASAILQARAQGLDLRRRIRIMWLGGSNNEITNEFNGNNDPWSMYVVCQSGIETWIMPAPVGARVRIDKRSEAEYYADNPLGRYLLKIVPAHNKPLFDPACLSAIISMQLKLGWVKESEPVLVSGPERGYAWTKIARASRVRLIRQIDQQAMKEDIFNTMKGKKRILTHAIPTGVTFHKDTLKRLDGRGDNWRPVWAADDSQITPMCDGSWLGIKQYHNHLYRIVGGPDKFLREDIPNYPDFSPKLGSWFGYGVVSVDGILYSVVSKTPGPSWSGPFRGIKLLKSRDNGETWCRVDRHGHERKLGPLDSARNEVNPEEMFFLEEFGLPHQTQMAYPFSFVDFVKCGKDNAAARDDYLYIYSPEGAYAHSLCLARVPKDKLGIRDAWEYFVRYQGSQATWTSDIKQRGYAHVFPEKSQDGNHFGWYSWIPSVVWNQGLGVYIMVNGGTYGGRTMSSADKDYYDRWMHTRSGSLGFWYSRNPYGPWQQFSYTDYWTVDDSQNRTYQPSLSPKWISQDGKDMVLIWSDAMKDEQGRSHTVNYRWNQMRISIQTGDTP